MTREDMAKISLEMEHEWLERDDDDGVATWRDLVREALGDSMDEVGKNKVLDALEMWVKIRDGRGPSIADRILRSRAARRREFLP